MKTYHIALIIFVGVAAWMLSGSLQSSSADAQPSAEAKPEATIAVRVQRSTAKAKAISLNLQGHTNAKRIVDINAQIGGTVIKTPVEKGQRVKKGELLCQLAAEDRPAQVLKEKARVEQAQLDFDGSKKLFDQKLIAASDLANKKAILKHHLALLEIAQINAQHLTIRAPFAGFVEARPANVGQLLQRGQTCARLIDESKLLATAKVTAKDVSQLNLKQEAVVKLGKQREISGHIEFIGQEADPITRTYNLEIALNNSQPVRSGMSVNIVIPIKTVQAHHIRSSVLALNNQEQLGVRVVDENQTVHFKTVSVVAEDSTGIWVTGLGESINLIVVGQELVTQGERVNANYVNDKK